MLNENREHDLIKEVKSNLIKSMQTKAEKLVNPFNYHLSLEAKKRFMKYVLKLGKKGVLKEDFWYQHRIIDFFTRIRATELTENPDSQEAAESCEEQKKKTSI